MIKSKLNLILAVLWLGLSVQNYIDRFGPAHRYTWVVYFIGSGVFLYSAFVPGDTTSGWTGRTNIHLGGGRYLAYVVGSVILFFAVPLWLDFREAGQPAWNGFLAAILIALVAGSFFVVRYLQRNRIEVGEARFSSNDSRAR